MGEIWFWAFWVKAKARSNFHNSWSGLWPIAVMKLYSSVGQLSLKVLSAGCTYGAVIISHPDIREFIHCKDGDDTLQNFNISVQLTDDFMKALM
ncbi:MAG: hypothetical protein CM1200mP3_10920 [Chloroflexota bacterium]|nr:MAG: hypothetical protein CM1200mP3_10920 [Chloroflexota bacterium]